MHRFIFLAIVFSAGSGPAALAAEADPYDAKAVAETTVPRRPSIIYTAANAPFAPNLEDLALSESLSQYGIRWTFEKPVRVVR